MFFQIFLALSLVAAPTQAVPMETSSKSHEHSQMLQHHNYHEARSTVSTKNLACCHSMDSSQSCHYQLAGFIFGSFPTLLQPMKGRTAYFSNLKAPKSKRIKPPDRPPIS